MRDALLKFFAPREEPLELAGAKLVVRELSQSADRAAFEEEGDHLYKFIVRCTFYAEGAEAGKPAFEDSDIPTLKEAGVSRIGPLIKAVSTVNGFNTDEEIKNSAAAPSGG